MKNPDDQSTKPTLSLTLTLVVKISFSTAASFAKEQIDTDYNKTNRQINRHGVYELLS